MVAATQYHKFFHNNVSWQYGDFITCGWHNIRLWSFSFKSVEILLYLSLAATLDHLTVSILSFWKRHLFEHHFTRIFADVLARFKCFLTTFTSCLGVSITLSGVAINEVQIYSLATFLSLVALPHLFAVSNARCKYVCLFFHLFANFILIILFI